MDVFWRAPPVARTLTALTLIESLLFWGRLITGKYIFFVPTKIFFHLPPQVWRLATCFFLTGPDLEFVFDLYNLWRYSSALESQSGRFSKPGDFFIYILFVSTVILLTAGFYLGYGSFLHALIMALVWTFAQDKRGTRVRFFVIDIPVIYLPAAMLCITMVRGGWPAMLLECTGILGAHLYDFITRLYPTFGGGRNFIFTPLFVQKFFYKHTPNSGYRGYGTAYHAPQPSESAPQSRASGADTGSSWGSWGSGRRLG
ncbi:hypothetical protein PMG11_01056 [Penicillium brasilianum]|uniref:Derlin n=1 Tax=Penicillium brasilianum TaxID=104259 RepID=A0A0F7TGW3_PENBI|nr:hypothetical protein PMG11_01056 [Penicillium brasilianum]